jgi:hypothetical protein
MTAFRRDQIQALPDAPARLRTMALQDAVDMTRRAASATQAAAAGLLDDSMRCAVLQGIHQRLLSLLEQLRALT